MPCFHPVPAYRNDSGRVTIGHDVGNPDAASLKVPCRTCIGCRRMYAQGWALRCWLEHQQHRESLLATLTYSDETLTQREPWRTLSLSKRDMQLFYKRLRKIAAGTIRHFTSGEYGDTTNRPHYHAILFGLGLGDRHLVSEAWGLGHAHILPISPEGISYIAGYAAKKYGKHDPYDHYQAAVNHETGEVYAEWEPTFRLMSRGGRYKVGGGGIGAAARQWTNSWRSHAEYNGTRIPVPRYLHEAWKAQASQLELDDLAYERQKLALERDTSIQRLEAGEKVAEAREALRTARRRL